MKKIAFLNFALLVFFAGYRLASAHAVVKPDKTGIAAFQTFALGVPSEKATSTVMVRLILPAGLNFVTPTVKPGWKAELKTEATGKQIKDDDGIMAAEQKPVEIDWTGGNIPAGQRDEFSFAAQVPGSETTLAWKVYQTYADNSTISWDHNPADPQPKNSKGQPDFSSVGPYSTTKVVKDLQAATAPAPSAPDNGKRSANLALTLSIVALALSAIANFRKRAV